ncbi:MAG: hypothetical protein AAGD14_07300 [Planctomycetota bacterium]
MYEVSLPADKTLRWPDRCVACGLSDANHRVRYEVSWSDDEENETERVVEAPACHRCVEDLQRTVDQRDWWIIGLILGGFVVASALLMLGGFGSVWTLVQIPIFLAVGWLVMGWFKRRPLALAVEDDEDRLKLTFTDERVAREFEALNR